MSGRVPARTGPRRPRRAGLRLVIVIDRCGAWRCSISCAIVRSTRSERRLPGRDGRWTSCWSPMPSREIMTLMPSALSVSTNACGKAHAVAEQRGLQPQPVLGGEFPGAGVQPQHQLMVKACFTPGVLQLHRREAMRRPRTAPPLPRPRCPTGSSIFSADFAT